MKRVFREMNYRNKSFWLEGGEYVESPPFSGDLECDLAIIGGGGTGLSSAYYIKKYAPSMNIVLLEAQVIGFGASGRNAGFAMPVEGWELDIHLWRMKKDQAKAYVDYSFDCVQNIGSLIRHENIDCDFQTVGMLEVARTPSQVKLIMQEIRRFHQLGYTDMAYLDATALKNYFNNAWYIGARRDPTVALLNPAKMVRGVKKVIEGLGVHIFEHTPVTQYFPGSKIELITPNGRVRASNIIVATNAFSMFLKIRHRYFIPMFTYIVLTEPIDHKRLTEMGWSGREAVVDKRLFIRYFRLTPDNRLLMGGRDALYYFGNSVVDRDTCHRVIKRLEHDVRGMFPMLEHVGITHRWGGPVAVTLDLVPTFGRHPGHKNVLFGLGYSGHGVAQSMGSGRILRDLLFDRDTPLVRLPSVNNRMIPIPPEPIRYMATSGIRNMMLAYDAIVEKMSF